MTVLDSCGRRYRRGERVTAWCCVTLVALAVATGCSNRPATQLQRLSEARRLGADLLVQFSQAADATNLAVMAETDETSAAFARDAEQKTEAVRKDAAALRPILSDLAFTNESRLLDEFDRRFAEYRVVDRSILDLSVENTNLKAQRLSFGPAQEAAEAFASGLEAAVSRAPDANKWRAEAFAARAVGAVREIQVLQAPHIAEADDAAMTRIEERMAASAKLARSALDALGGLVQPAARSQFGAAVAALDRFDDLNRQIVVLSRRNSDVRSLALSLGKKRMLTAASEDTLHALQDALNTREFSATR